MVSAPRCPPGARGLLTLLLLLPLPGARGQCGTLPTLSRAVPRDTSHTEGFPIGTEVTYRCLDGFVKIPGKSDTVVCLSNSEWSPIGEFCDRGCGETPRLKSATLSAEDTKKNYSPPGTTVSYVCRPGYEETELRPVITCLENSTWSEAPEFCKGKSCGVPKGPENGRAVDTTNYLYGARVNIICDEGFGLRGRTFIQCTRKGDQVEWSQLPTCEEMECKPLELENGRVHFTDLRFGATANFSCNEGYRLIGPTSAQCVVAGNGVDWDKEVPLCEDIITQDKPTTVPPKGTEVAGTASVITTQDKPTTVPLKGTEVAGTSSDSTLNTIGHSTELEDIITQDKPTTVSPKGTEVAGTSSVITTQDKPTTVPLKGTEVAGTSSDSTLNAIGHSTELEDSALNTIGHSTELEVIITQDKPTTVPPKGTEVAGTSSGSALNTAGNSTVPEGEGSGIDTHFGIAGIGLGISLGIAGIAIITSIAISFIICICVIVIVYIRKYQTKNRSYSVNPDSPKHQITTTAFQV